MGIHCYLKHINKLFILLKIGLPSSILKEVISGSNYPRLKPKTVHKKKVCMLPKLKYRVI